MCACCRRSIPSRNGTYRDSQIGAGLIFIGGFQHPANVDGVPYFVREILPRIHERLPDVIFQVIGPDAPDEVLAVSSSCVHFLGFVPEVTPLFDQARVAVAPIRFGAG